MTTPSLAVEADALGRRYGARWALCEVTLRIPRGRVILVTGRNGAGKSTLLRVLATAARADAGEARVLGRDVRKDREGVRRLTALLDHRSHLYGELTARENLEGAAAYLERPASARPVPEILAQVGLFSRADDVVSTFSAGMRKRLSLARVLLQEPEVVLLDEPYGELDPSGFALVDSLLEGWRQGGKTVLLSTHLLERGQALGDDALVLAEGRVAWQGAAHALPPPGAAS